MNPHTTRNIITSFIRTRIEESGATGAIIGLSGGIDSSVTAYLATGAIGRESVLGILLPVQDLTPNEDLNDAIDVANRLGIAYKTIEIGDLVHAFSVSIPDYDLDSVAVNGNLTARIRMCVLYYYANLMNRLVVGTSNRTELLLGYATKYGDAGVDVEPIGDLYKTEVFELACFLGIPKRVIEKPPSARLWAGQTDEGELGMRYADIDRILKLLIDYKLSVEEIVAQGVPEADVLHLADLVRASEHKRSAPPLADIRS
jgi:NAD+ synthase